MKLNKYFHIILFGSIFLCNNGFAQIKDSDPLPSKRETPKSAIKKDTKAVEPVSRPETTSNNDVKTKLSIHHEFEMVMVQGGSYNMGNDDGSMTEKPMHLVTVSSFLIGKYEVSQAQWFEIMGNYPSKHAGCNECPVENVSWNEIQDFITKLNKKTGKKYRLPTEAEWEYAARGGNKNNHYSYSGSNNYSDVGWNEDNSNKETHPVGKKQPNELGIFDMSGNVWEWCSDWYDKNYYANSPSQNPTGANTGNSKVRRGGSWDDNAPKNSKTTCRNYAPPDIRQNYNGFRLCMSY